MTTDRTLAQRLGGIAFELQETARGWAVAAKADFNRGDMAAYDAHKAMSGCYDDAANRIFEAIGGKPSVREPGVPGR